MVGRLEQEKKLGVLLDQAVLQAKQTVREGVSKLKGFKVKQLLADVQDQERALDRMRTSLSQITAFNNQLRLQIDTYRKDRLDYHTLDRSRSFTRKQFDHKTQFLRGRSFRALGEVEVIHSRISSLQSLHHDRSFSLQERALGLAARIKEDKRRNKAFIKSIDERKPEYTIVSACIKALFAKWTEKVRTKREELTRHTTFVASLTSGFQVLNSSGGYDNPGSIAKATIAALAAVRSMLQRLLELRDEEEHLVTMNKSATRRLEASRKSRELADKEAADTVERLQVVVTDREKELGSLAIRVKLLQASIEDLGPVLREYHLILASFSPFLPLPDSSEPETVLAALKPLETGTIELATLLAVMNEKKRTPWPEMRVRTVVPVGIGTWESGEVGRPRTLEEFRAMASRSLLNQSIPYIRRSCTIRYGVGRTVYIPEVPNLPHIYGISRPNPLDNAKSNRGIDARWSGQKQEEASFQVPANH